MSTLNYLFELYFYTSIKGAILIVLILTLQRFFRKDFTARWIYSLWLFPIIRLFSPFSPIRYSLSLYSLGLIKRFRFTTKDLLLGRLIIASDHFKIIGDTISTQSFINDAFSFHWISFFSIIWIIGIFMLSLFFISIRIKLNCIIKNASICMDEDLLYIFNLNQRKLSFTKNLDIYVSSEIDSPMAYGILSPVIVLPHAILSVIEKEKIRHILLHELIHIKRRDILFTHIGIFICILHWYNPLVWIGFLKSKEDCELACDETVLYTLTPNEYAHYGLTLIQMLELVSSSTPFHPVVAKTLLYARSEANTRILQISKFHRKRKSVVLLSMCLLFFISLMSFNEASNTRITKQPLDYNLSQYINALESDIRHEFGGHATQTYLLYINDSPYFILYYNILGEKVEFWFDGSIGNQNKKVLEITTTSYQGLKQGMSMKKAQKIIQNLSLQLIEIKKSTSLTQYIYKDEDASLMILFDTNSDKLYSLTLY